MRYHSQAAIAGRPGLRGIPERIRCVRQIRQMTQEELAKRIPISTPEISRWENGERTPGANSLHRLCKILNVSADYLMGLADEKEKILQEKDLQAASHNG